MLRTEKRQVLSATVLVAILSTAFLVSIVLTPVNHLNTFEPTHIVCVACVGDSITEGTEYPQDLRALLGDNYFVANCGAGGTTALSTSDKPYLNSLAFQRALAFEPEIVIIMLGTNDANPKYFGNISRFVDDYKTIISRFEKFNPEIWILKPPPIFNDNFGPYSENLVQGIMPRIDQVAQELNLPTIDIYPLLIDHPDYFWDGVHPDWQGAKIIADAVYQAVFAHRASP
ncbi:MAG: GDSL-type esterase/lipase family protein [Candidatus Bathyarchaeota archaeon]|nr:GDSL-type esterase/lipase family protein [Candidatus Bathyarchaeota archaeon]